MTAPEPYASDVLWSAGEVREQAEQVPGQLDVWDMLDEPEVQWPCGRCGKGSGDHPYDCLDGPFPRLERGE